MKNSSNTTRLLIIANSSRHLISSITETSQLKLSIIPLIIETMANIDFSLIITIIYGTSYGLVILSTSIYCAWRVRQGIIKTTPSNTTPIPKRMTSCLVSALSFFSTLPFSFDSKQRFCLKSLVNQKYIN